MEVRRVFLAQRLLTVTWNPVRLLPRVPDSGKLVLVSYKCLWYNALRFVAGLRCNSPT